MKPRTNKLDPPHRIIEKNDIRKILSKPLAYHSKRLGGSLVKNQLITKSQLQKALNLQPHDRRKLGQILINMGLLSQDELNAILAIKLGIPRVSIAKFNLDPAILALIPTDTALKHLAIPLCLLGNDLVIAIADPTDLNAEELVRFASGYNLRPVLATATEISTALILYGNGISATLNVLDHELETLEFRSETGLQDESENDELLQQPIVKLLNAILWQGVKYQASDILIQPGSEHLDIAMRINGRINRICTLPITLLSPLINRVRVISKLQIGASQVPQDGRAVLCIEGKYIDLRISIIPVIRGSSAVIRLLDRDKNLKPLDQLGFDPQLSAELKSIALQQNGLFLVTGPTGEGKSTTLHALLAERMDGLSHIVTVEDPVEYHIDGLTQIQIDNTRGHTFSKALSAVLRHSPDVIMIGEIRDAETARIAAASALSGHLVLSTLHTIDATGAIIRLREMGVDDYKLGAIMMGVLAMRLVPINCPQYRAPHIVDPVSRASLGIPKDLVLYKSTGCLACQYSGIERRVPICELLSINTHIRHLINKAANAEELCTAATDCGMRSLRSQYMDLAHEGLLSFDELRTRVPPRDNHNPTQHDALEHQL